MPSTTYSDRYPDPVAKLLTFGENALEAEEWRDYKSDGLTAEHIPTLIELAQDEELYYEAWPDPAARAPIHAWRALGQLQAVDALDMLLRLMDLWQDEEWVVLDMPIVIAMLGPSVLDTLGDAFERVRGNDITGATIVEAIHEIAQRTPEVQPQCVAVLTAELENYGQNHRWVNARLVHALTELNIVDAAPLMEKAFAADAVDLSLMGDWESVQIALGLLDARITPERDWQREEMYDEFPELFEDVGLLDAQALSDTHTDADKKRKKARKQAQATKKKQRKPKKKKKKRK